jgi:hypothetical protein
MHHSDPASRGSDGGRLRLEGGQPSRGPRGSMHVDGVAGFTWIEWQGSHGLGGRLPWNMHPNAASGTSNDSSGVCVPSTSPLTKSGPISVNVRIMRYPTAKSIASWPP